MLNKLSLFITVSCFGLFSTFSVEAQPGTPDLSFSTDGRTTFDYGGQDIGYAVAVQPDGKILVAGSSYNGWDDDVIVIRYNTNGSYDATFGYGGLVTIDVNNSFEWANGIAVQSDGKIIVVGMTDANSDADFLIIRLESDGSIDYSFDGSGIVTTDFSGDQDYATSVVIQSNDKIVVAGYGRDGGTNKYCVARYNTDGSLDISFDTDGKVITAIDSYDDIANSVALQSDGKIVVAGTSEDNGSGRFGVVRYNSDGSLDNTFDGDGKLTTTVSIGYDWGYAVSIQTDDKIVVGGFGYEEFIMARYNSDGSLDNTFSSDGKVYVLLSSTYDQAYAMKISNEGKVYLAGTSYNGHDWDFSISRFNADGSTDATFGTGGLVMTDFSGRTESCNAIALTSNGQIVVVGDAYNGSDNDIAVAKYNKCGTVITAATTSASVCSGTSATLSAGAGSALSFDGVNDYVEVTSASSLNAYPLTVSAMVKTTSSGTGNYGIINKYAPGSYNGYNIFMTSGHVYAHYFRNSSNYCYDFGGGHGIDGGLINDGVWHQIAMTVDATGAHLYVDGVLKGSRVWTGTAGACTTTEPLLFGKYSNGYLSGEMDEVRLWRTSQSASTLLANKSVSVLTDEANLFGYWRLDDGAGMTTTDNTGTGNTGALKNGVSWIASTTAINSGLTYSWSPATGLSSTTGASVTATPGTDQTYIVTGTDAGGCTSSTTIDVTLHTNPSPTLDPFSDACSTGSSFSLRGGSPSNGTYSGTGVSNGNFNPAISGPGTFPITYTYIDGNRCTATANQNMTVSYTSACVPLTTLAAGYQNITLTSLNDRIYFNWISGATNYEVNVVSASLGYDQTFTTGTGTVFRMSNFTGIAYSTTYDVKVRAKVSGVYGNYATIYTVTTNACPLTQLATGYCNSTISALNDHLYFDAVTGATNYDINVTNASLSYDQTYTVGTSPVFRMSNFSGIAYSTTYDVKVRPKISGVYGAYGSVCTITTNAFTTTNLASGYCNITLLSMTNNLYYDYIAGASNYDVNVVNTGLSYNQTITKGATTNFRMTNFPGMVANTIYDVYVRAKINGVYGPYGSVCTVTTPVSLARSSEPDALNSPPLVGADNTLSHSVSLSVFPNPFTENINILFTPDDDSPAQLNIYDLAGRNIYTYENFPVNVKTQCIASLHWQPGLYFVEIVQGNTKTIHRIVKIN